MKKIIATGKGGVGKTTTLTTVSLLMAREGRRVIVFDTDPSMNLALSFGIPYDSVSTITEDKHDINSNLEDHGITESGQEILEEHSVLTEDGIRIVGKYVDENSIWGASVLLYIDNDSGKNVTVQADDMSINGFMVTPFFSSSVYNGRMSIDGITILSSDLEKNGITSVDEIELKFHIFNTDTFETIKDSDIITFSTK
jgi:energy-coupling factor transporter ATP-binding protein EcfA2